MDSILHGFGQVGPSSILAYLVLLIMLGKLVPRRTVDALLSDKDRQLARQEKELDDWRTAYKTEAKTSSVAINVANELTESARVANHIIQQLPGVSHD